MKAKPSLLILRSLEANLEILFVFTICNYLLYGNV